MTYQPKVIDTSKVTLDPRLLELTELLAKNTHDNWSLLRFSDGWVYGNKRDDFKKEHPCLVEYEQLPESEKEYDRKTAMETLKAIVALGYGIEKE